MWVTTKSGYRWGRRLVRSTTRGSGARSASVADLADLHSNPASDYDVSDERRREDPVIDHPRRVREPSREGARIVDGTKVVGDHALIGAARHSAHAGGGERPQRRRKAEGQ